MGSTVSLMLSVSWHAHAPQAPKQGLKQAAKPFLGCKTALAWGPAGGMPKCGGAPSMGCCGGGSTLKCCGVGTCPHTAGSASHLQAAARCRIGAGMETCPGVREGGLLPTLLSAACEMQVMQVAGMRGQADRAAGRACTCLATLMEPSPAVQELTQAGVSQQPNTACLAQHAGCTQNAA